MSIVLGYGQLIRVSAETRHSLAEAGLSRGAFALLHLSLDVGFVAVFTVVGWIIYLKRRADPMTLLTALALVVWGPHNGSLVGNGYGPPTTGLPASIGAAAVGLLGYGSWMLFFYLFPSGHFVPRWTRLFAAAWVVMVVIWAATPFGPPHWPALPRLMLVIGLWGSFPASQIYRYWRVSTTTQRLQTKWVVFGIAVGVIGLTFSSYAVGALFGPPAENAVRRLVTSGLDDVFVALIPISIGIAILRHRLFDIDLILNRTLVYGTLTAVVVGGYTLIVGALGTLLEARGSLALSLLATGAVAVIFQPLRQWVQGAVNRLFYGERDDPYSVIARLGRELEAALAPDAVLPTVADTVRNALKLPYVTIASRDGSLAATVGEPRGELLRIPLMHAGELVGELGLSSRAPGEPFTPTERRLLGDLAHSAGAAVQSVRLTRQLQRSREQLVLAREEERKRLRRDLHDDLAPSLAALALTASTAADLIPAHAAEARRRVEELQRALRSSVGEVRRIAHDLRPPTLDELGLLAAVHERAEQYHQRAATASGDPRKEERSEGGNPQASLRVIVEAPDHLPPLTAAAEVAAFRIIQEALMNVVRHAAAQQCRIRLALVDAATGTVLEVSVEDDGVGLPDLEGRPAGGWVCVRCRNGQPNLGENAASRACREGEHAFERAFRLGQRTTRGRMDPLRVVIADDHPLFRHGLGGVLEAAPDIALVGEATSGDEAIALAESLQPDVVLMDIQMPGTNGIEATRAIVQTSPQIRVLVLTMFQDDASVFTAMRAGARGYVLKDAEKDDILRAIRAVGRGEAIFSPVIAGRVIDFFANANRAAPKEAFPTLTEREREILQLLAQHRSNADIARDLMLSPKTVSNYLSNIFSKLQVADRAEAILRAREAGLGP